MRAGSTLKLTGRVCLRNLSEFYQRSYLPLPVLWVAALSYRILAIPAGCSSAINRNGHRYETVSVEMKQSKVSNRNPIPQEPCSYDSNASILPQSRDPCTILQLQSRESRARYHKVPRDFRLLRNIVSGHQIAQVIPSRAFQLRKRDLYASQALASHRCALLRTNESSKSSELCALGPSSHRLRTRRPRY